DLERTAERSDRADELEAGRVGRGARRIERDLEVAIERIAVRGPVLSLRRRIVLPLVEGEAGRVEREDHLRVRKRRTREVELTARVLEVRQSAVAADARVVEDVQRVRRDACIELFRGIGRGLRIRVGGVVMMLARVGRDARVRTALLRRLTRGR